MAPNRTERKGPATDPDGMFAGMVVFFVETGIQSRRLQIWKQKLQQMGGTVEMNFSRKVTHVFAESSDALLQKIGRERLARFKGHVLLYQWLEDSLASGERVSEDLYSLHMESEGDHRPGNKLSPKPECPSIAGDDEQQRYKRSKSSPEGAEVHDIERKGDAENGAVVKVLNAEQGSDSSPEIPSTPDKDGDLSDSSLSHQPPDLNKNIIEIFSKLIDIYRALGEDRRSFSYYKAITVIDKLPFKIESVDQVKNLPGIGKSMQDHIQEIVTTGKLSKLEHFKSDEKVRTISLFGDVWGIGPATALKLYEKGLRSLDDLKNEEALTNSQKLGVKYFNDIKTRIPRHEVQEMESLLQKVGEEILPGVTIVCGGSYRRGKATCGDMDIVITHPDGKSHKGFLSKYVQRLKEMKFLREDLVFSTHSEEGTDSGVDTYFGLCTYPGRELRHRIDLKVYPRDIYAFGLVAWTGNDVLNRRLRLLAESKGYRLDDTGLFIATHGSDGKRGARATTSVKLYTEKEVFDFLGFPWLEPHERNL